MGSYYKLEGRRGSHYRLWKAKHIHAGRMYGKLRKESKYMLVANRANTS